MTKTLAWIVGVVTIIAGVWGLVMTPVLEVFDTNVALAIVWLVTGLIILAVTLWWEESLSVTLIVLGIIYAILGVWGLVMQGEVLGFLTNTSADDWLHIVLAVVMLAGGYLGWGAKDMGMQSSMGSM